MAKVNGIERIVIFADGTGNAFSTQESNVWRLYEALDLAAPDQVAHYIKGVGTSGFRPFAILDGATGIGVPSNVRKLYRFLCWNWRPGVEIYLFGFSRGSFTIRTLVGLIASQGLVPDEFETKPAGMGKPQDTRGDATPAEPERRERVSRAEMKRNAMAAWRAYRAESAPNRQVGPFIVLTRWLRDGLLALYHAARGHRPYAEVSAERERQGRSIIDIRFLGLFDTVEAYGVPVNELRAAIDRVIWPISFRNFRLSQTVRYARHALSLDDERTTFHPLRFDMEGQDGGAKDARIREVWFSGVHSDVGGGYPEGALSYVPLAWMMDEALAVAPQGAQLRFLPGSLPAIRKHASALAPKHDSRSGTGALYRYGPRPISTDRRFSGGPPIIHHSVAEKMIFGTENYAPLTLPHVARVLMPNGALRDIHGFRPAIAARAAPPSAEQRRAETAVTALSDPNPSYVEWTLDTIWWRRVGYFALLFFVLVTVGLPLTAFPLGHGVVSGFVWAAQRLGVGPQAEVWQARVLDAQRGLGSSLTEVSTTLGGFVPSYAKGWVQALVENPIGSFIILLATFAIYRWNGALGDRIADRARCAWFINPQAETPPQAPRPAGSRLARRLRTAAWARAVSRIVSRRILPAVALTSIAVAALLLVNRAAVTYRSGSGKLCPAQNPEFGLRVPKPGVANLAEGYTTDHPCWPTGIKVEKGRSYIIWIEETSPYLDGPDLTGIAGFTDTWWSRHTLAKPLARWWAGDWFQPVARIGASGNVEWLLQSATGETAAALTKTTRLPKSAWPRMFDKAVPESADLSTRQEKARLRQRFVSTFTAQGTGELFLFVNDAVVAVPFLPTFLGFYANNNGAAKVTVELQPEPEIPAGQPYDFSTAP